MSGSISDVFSSIFECPAARDRLASLGAHISLATFSLTTTSLRHLPRWYDRIEEIQNGVRKSRPNFLSDPEAIGLIYTDQSNGSVSLTPVGKEFLKSKSYGYSDPCKGEYKLIDLLYYQGMQHTHYATNFLNRKKENLIKFLSMCSPTPGKKTLN